MQMNDGQVASKPLGTRLTPRVGAPEWSCLSQDGALVNHHVWTRWAVPPDAWTATVDTGGGRTRHIRTRWLDALSLLGMRLRSFPPQRVTVLFSESVEDET